MVMPDCISIILSNKNRGKVIDLKHASDHKQNKKLSKKKRVRNKTCNGDQVDHDSEINNIGCNERPSTSVLHIEKKTPR